MERSILENMVFAFMVGELGIEPITARKEVEKMTDEQLEKFIDQPKRSDLGASTAGRSPGADDGRPNKKGGTPTKHSRHQSKKKGKGIIAQFPKWYKIMKKINTLEVIGKRWFQKSYGNTYHTATVIENGEELKSGIKYGYENAYLQTAADLLRANGYEVPADNLKAFQMMREYPHSVKDVKRKKDL